MPPPYGARSLLFTGRPIFFPPPFARDAHSETNRRRAYLFPDARAHDGLWRDGSKGITVAVLTPPLKTIAPNGTMTQPTDTAAGVSAYAAEYSTYTRGARNAPAAGVNLH